MTERTWEIEDANGRRRVTLAEFRAILNERKPYTDAIMAGVRAGDMAATAKAQEEMRRRFA